MLSLSLSFSLSLSLSLSLSQRRSPRSVSPPLSLGPAGLLVMLALQFLTPYFVFIPKATLSAVIICAVIYMIEIEIVRPMWRSRREWSAGRLWTFVDVCGTCGRVEGG